MHGILRQQLKCDGEGVHVGVHVCDEECMCAYMCVMRSVCVCVCNEECMCVCVCAFDNVCAFDGVCVLF